jgi:hypothetical protein
MKKRLSIAFMVLLSASMVAYAQPKNALKINILSPVLKTFNVSYERVLTESSSAQLGFYVTSASAAGLKYSGIGLTPEVRFYLSDSDAPEGFYVGPFLRYQSLKLEVKDTGDKANISSIGAGVIIGKQWLFKERVTFDIFLGPSYSGGTVKATSGSSSDFDVSGGVKGFGLRAGITLGVAF